MAGLLTKKQVLEVWDLIKQETPFAEIENKTGVTPFYIEKIITGQSHRKHKPKDCYFIPPRESRDRGLEGITTLKGFTPSTERVGMKFSPENLLYIWEQKSKGISNLEIAKQLNCGATTIYKVVNQQVNGHLKPDWLDV